MLQPFHAVLAVVLLAAAATAERAQAQAAVATASDVDTDRQIAAWLADDAGEARPGPALEAPDQAVHGKAEVGFGSNGYRLARLSDVVPLGTGATVGVALADESAGDRRSRADRSSFALSLRLGDDGPPGEPCGLSRTGVRLSSDLHQVGLCGQAGGLEAAPP